MLVVGGQPITGIGQFQVEIRVRAIGQRQVAAAVVAVAVVRAAGQLAVDVVVIERALEKQSVVHQRRRGRHGDLAVQVADAALDRCGRGVVGWACDDVQRAGLGIAAIQRALGAVE